MTSKFMAFPYAVSEYMSFDSRTIHVLRMPLRHGYAYAYRSHVRNHVKPQPVTHSLNVNTTEVEITLLI